MSWRTASIPGESLALLLATVRTAGGTSAHSEPQEDGDRETRTTIPRQSDLDADDPTGPR